jgi:hypothetical protein
MYEMSAYLAAHRCQVTIGLAFYSAEGYYLGGAPAPWYTVATGGKLLSKYNRIGTRFLAPRGAVSMKAFIRKKDTNEGESDSWIWALRPQVAQVAQVEQVSLLDNITIAEYTPSVITAADLSSSGTTVIDGGRITTNSISANKIKTNEIIIGSNNINISANGMYIRDSNGVLRVKLGNLSYSPTTW